MKNRPLTVVSGNMDDTEAFTPMSFPLRRFKIDRILCWTVDSLPWCRNTELLKNIWDTWMKQYLQLTAAKKKAMREMIGGIWTPYFSVTSSLTLQSHYPKKFGFLNWWNWCFQSNHNRHYPRTFQTTPWAWFRWRSFAMICFWRPKTGLLLLRSRTEKFQVFQCFVFWMTFLIYLPTIRKCHSSFPTSEWIKTVQYGVHRPFNQSSDYALKFEVPSLEGMRCFRTVYKPQTLNLNAIPIKKDKQFQRSSFKTSVLG